MRMWELKRRSLSFQSADPPLISSRRRCCSLPPSPPLRTPAVTHLRRGTRPRDAHLSAMSSPLSRLPSPCPNPHVRLPYPVAISKDFLGCACLPDPFATPGHAAPAPPPVHIEHPLLVVDLRAPHTTTAHRRHETRPPGDARMSAGGRAFSLGPCLKSKKVQKLPRQITLTSIACSKETSIPTLVSPM